MFDRGVNTALKIGKSLADIPLTLTGTGVLCNVTAFAGQNIKPNPNLTS